MNRDARDRQFLRRHIAEVGHDDRVDALVRRFRVRYVYFGSRTYETARHVMDLSALRRAPGLREVFERGGAHVFEVVPANT